MATIEVISSVFWLLTILILGICVVGVLLQYLKRRGKEDKIRRLQGLVDKRFGEID